MLANDLLGDCTCADVLHHRMLQASVAHAATPLTFTDQEAITLYEQFGYVAGNPSTDNGANMLDVQNYMKANAGIAGFVTLDVGNIEQVKAALYLFGGIDIGFQVPGYIMQVPAGGSWSQPASGADPTIEGGHAVLGCGYGRSGIRVVSWGTTYTFDFSFWANYVDEAYCWVSTDWIKASGVSPTGVDLAGLLSDLQSI
jgi:hypothetical protein